MLNQVSEMKVEEKKELIVEYKGEFYDLSRFISKHPGGRNFLEGKSNKKIDQGFVEAGHSEAAENLLKEYKIKQEDGEAESLEVGKY